MEDAIATISKGTTSALKEMNVHITTILNSTYPMIKSMIYIRCGVEYKVDNTSYKNFESRVGS
ncbi:hypothetical protein CCACVL1_30017 [Corchorus capsularis]|uniref:Uncharacterized protein n=1 Tax=Corchorus capsularis TaxID=210143 RepID=A0A1R3FZ29_COCAP|nr:hypothetical protein CCACVL1_30017 [Corchorus capsularis]